MKINRALNYSASAFLIIFLSGLIIIWWVSQAQLVKEEAAKLNKAIQGIDRVLSHAQQAASQARSYKLAPCNENTLTELRKIVAGTPYIRSVSLMNHRHIYCSSVFGNKISSYSSDGYYNGALMVINNNSLTPERSVLIYRSADKYGEGALIGIDGYYLYGILSLLSSDSETGLVVGGRYMSSQGVVSQDQPNSHTLTLSSSAFPFSVQATESTTSHLNYIIRVYTAELIATTLLSLFIAFAIYRYTAFRNTIDCRLDKAIKKGCIYPVIQPVICASSGRICGGEVLLRWALPDGGHVPPDIFIPAAEKSGKIKLLTTLAIETVTNECTQAGSTVPDEFILFFNVSSANFEDATLLNDCILASYTLGQCNIRLGLEITERTLIEENAFSKDILATLRKFDIKIALDDFGTGNANYTYIRQFNPHFLKIDKAFTRSIASDPVSQGFVRNMISLAELAGCNTIAEGVENELQADKLKALGVDYLQGFYYLKPLPLNQFFNSAFSNTQY